MWSDPPVTPEGLFCFFACTDAGMARLNALLDDPANDARPFRDLQAEAKRYEREYLRGRLTPAALKRYPLDPADDPGFLRCEPWGMARQIFAPHQLKIRQPGADRLERSDGTELLPGNAQRLNTIEEERRRRARQRDQQK